MPEYSPNLLLGQPAFSESLMRALAIKGDLPRELYPLYGVQFTLDDFSKPEYHWTRRTSRWEAGIIVTAGGAGNLARSALLTRTSAANQRQIMAVVESIEVTTSTAGGTGIQAGLAFASTGVADPTADASRRDDRIFGKASNAFSVTGGAPGAVNPLAGLNPLVYVLAQNQNLVIPGPWIMTNNDNSVVRASLLVVATTANTDLRVNYRWVERDLLPEEI